MQLIEMTMSQEHVRLLYGDRTSKDESGFWVELQAPSKGDDNRRLGVIQVEALRLLRSELNAEFQRLEALAIATHG